MANAKVCPICNYNDDDDRTQCSRCGTLLPKGTVARPSIKDPAWRPLETHAPLPDPPKAKKDTSSANDSPSPAKEAPKDS